MNSTQILLDTRILLGSLTVLLNSRMVAAALRRFFAKCITTHKHECDGLGLYRIRSQTEFLAHQARNAERLAKHMQCIEMIESTREKIFFVPGYSYSAGRQDKFLIERGVDGHINWRETANCSITGFNNRMRATFHLFDIEMAPYSDIKLYITEQITPIYSYFADKFPNVVGSEFLGDQLPFGSVNENGVRNETLSALSFPDQSFDTLVSLDVLEHIPDYEQAFRECARVLKDDGKMMWSVPFIPSSPTNLIRAKIEGGEIVLIQPPEYHGDPLSSDGVLCYQHFGWQMLDEMRNAGFRDAYAICYHSIEFGYLGGEQFMFVAIK